MVGDHPQGIVVQVIHTQYPGRWLDQRLEQVDLVVAVHVLHHRGDALQAHAGIHRGLGQRVHLTVWSRLYCMNTRFQISM